MAIVGIPHEELSHKLAAQEWLAEGRQEGLQEGCLEGRQEGCQQEAASITTRIQPLPLDQFESLA